MRIQRNITKIKIYDFMYILKNYNESKNYKICKYEHILRRNIIRI